MAGRSTTKNETHRKAHSVVVGFGSEKAVHYNDVWVDIDFESGIAELSQGDERRIFATVPLGMTVIMWEPHGISGAGWML